MKCNAEKHLVAISGDTMQCLDVSDPKKAILGCYRPFLVPRILRQKLHNIAPNECHIIGVVASFHQQEF